MMPLLPGPAQVGGSGGGAPAAHAATHKHAGSDEVATATPTANAIPKAGAGGQLAIGYLASGTPTGTKFVRDDGTLAVPSATAPGWNIVSRTTAYTAAISDFILCDVSGGTFAVTLPTAVSQAGNRIAVKKSNRSGGYVTVQTTSSQTLDGRLTTRIFVPGTTLVFVSDGSNWRLEGNFDIPLYYVTDFGAVGDGTTDDRAAIQAAIDAVPASGGIVMCDSLEYGIGSPGLVIAGKPVLLMGLGVAHWRGEGLYWGTVFKLLAASLTGMTFKTGDGTGVYQEGMAAENITIVDFTTANTSTAFYVEACNMWHLKNCSGGDCRNGLVTQADHFTGAANVATPVLNTPTTPAGGSLTNGQVYRVCITAQNATAETDQSNEFLVTPSGANLSIALGWTRVTNATRYRVYIATGADGAWKYHGDVADPTNTYTITSVASVVNLRPPWQNETRTLVGGDLAWWYVEDCTWQGCSDAMFFYSSLSGKVLGGFVNGGVNQIALRVGMRGAQVKVSDGWYAVGASYIVVEGSQCSFDGFCLEGNPTVEMYHSNRPRAGAQDSNGASNNYVNNYQLVATGGYYGVTPIGIWMHVDAGKTAYSNQIGMGTTVGTIVEVQDDSAGAQIFSPSIFKVGYSTSTIGFYGHTPVARPSTTNDITSVRNALISLGLIT